MKFSIIVPTYNREKYIAKCIDSVLNQTYNNFELIIVDDSSEYSEYSFLIQVLKKYNFKYFVHRNSVNLGPGNARNIGINKSNGRYITFIDSDDYVEGNMMEEIEKVLEDDEYDAILFDYYYVIKGKKKVRKALPKSGNIIDSSDALALCNGMCWGKVFNKKTIEDNNIVFPNLMRSEDLAFVKSIIGKCNNIYYINKALYNYFINPFSIMHRKDTLNINNNMEAYNYIKKNVKKSEALNMVFLRDYIYIIVQNMILLKYNNREIKEFINNETKDEVDCFSNKYILYQPTYLKICFWLIKNRCINLLKIIFLLKK